MYTVKRMCEKELFNSKEEVVNYFGRNYSPEDADQGHMIITNVGTGDQVTIASGFDWECFVD